MKQKVIVLDLDGSLYDCSHRQHLAEAKQWDEFHSLLMGDTINLHVLRIVEACSTMNLDKVIVITGRSEKWRSLTMKKFEQDGVDMFIDDLHMRPDDNFQKSPDLKMGMIKALVGPDFKIEEIAFAIEDRDDVIERFIANKIPVIGVPK